jgi:hypothetical protein
MSVQFKIKQIFEAHAADCERGSFDFTHNMGNAVVGARDGLNGNGRPAALSMQRAAVTWRARIFGGNGMGIARALGPVVPRCAYDQRLPSLIWRPRKWVVNSRGAPFASCEPGAQEHTVNAEGHRRMVAGI